MTDSLPPSPETPRNRFANWATDLLTEMLRGIANNTFEHGSEQHFKLMACADRLDALYYGEANQYRAPVSSSPSETTTNDATGMFLHAVGIYLGEGNMRPLLVMGYEDKREIGEALKVAAEQWKSSVPSSATARERDTERLAKAIEILLDMYDETPCVFTPDGWCQAHNWFTSPAEDVTDPSDRGVCPHRRAQEYFAQSGSGETQPAPTNPPRRWAEGAARDARVHGH